MNINPVPDSECQRSIDALENPTKTVLLFDGRINNNGVADNSMKGRMEHSADTLKGCKYSLYGRPRRAHTK